MFEKRLRGTFFLTLTFFWGLFGFASYFEAGSLFTSDRSAEIQARIQQIDRETEELQEMKRGFEARALRHDNQAEYLQFNDKTTLETRCHLQLADENRAKAAKTQQQIDRLQAEKQDLLRRLK